jgi:hypothetical protein
MWDKDITTANELIGESKILLGEEQYEMLIKSYKRKQRVVMKKKDTSKKQNNEVDRFWVVFTNPEELDKDGDYIP